MPPSSTAPAMLLHGYHFPSPNLLNQRSLHPAGLFTINKSRWVSGALPRVTILHWAARSCWKLSSSTFQKPKEFSIVVSKTNDIKLIKCNHRLQLNVVKSCWEILRLILYCFIGYLFSWLPKNYSEILKRLGVKKLQVGSANCDNNRLHGRGEWDETVCFFSRSIHKCCMYYEVSTRTTQDSRSHLLNSQKQHVVAILDSLIFQWTSKAIACRWLIYLANNKHGKPRASQSSCNKVLSWALFMEQNLRFGLLWAGFDQFGGVW